MQITTDRTTGAIESFDEKIVRLFLQGVVPADIGKRCGTPASDIRDRLEELGYEAKAKTVNMRTCSVWDMPPERQRLVFAERAAKAAGQARKEMPTPELPAPMAQPVMAADIPEPEFPPDVSPRALRMRWKPILKEVAEEYGISVMEIISRRRAPQTVLARHAAVWRIRNETPLSLTEIGVRLNLDHSTVIYGVKKHEQRLAEAQGRAA